MSQIYEAYQKEFTIELDQANKKLVRASYADDIKSVKSHLSDCERNIKLMETELFGQPPYVKKQKYTKLKTYRKSYDELRKRVYQKQNYLELQENKKSLMGTRPSSSDIISQGDRSQEVTDNLRSAVGVMYQNLEIDENMNHQLKRQSERIVKSKGKVEQIKYELIRGDRKIKSMIGHARKNKWIVRGVLAFLFLLFVALVLTYII